MDHPILPITSGDATVDRVVAAVIHEFTSVSPGSLRALYLFGSFVDGSVVAASDIDLFAVLGAQPPEDAALVVGHVADAVTAQLGRRVELVPLDEARLLCQGHWRLESAARLVAGHDLRHRLPRQTLDRYLSTYTHAPYAYMGQVLRGCDRLLFPLGPPAPSAEFAGYSRTSRDGSFASVEAFVATACWIATLLAGLQAGRMVASRHDSPAVYREAVGGPWADFVADVYRLGKLTWAYRVPAVAADRYTLQALVDLMPAFENHYLRRYRDYLLERLASPDPAARLQAATRLRDWVTFPDPLVRAVLAGLADGEDERLRAVAQQALARIDAGTSRRAASMRGTRA